ncbi:MAG: choloylglycine hydrolase [Erysipelotrichaceae bacterium]|nr:choloylglycine hydrolase [Erysipelotrichaceae bacterium]
MCTAAVYKTENTYFGRNLDYEFSYGEEIVIVPRNFTLKLRHEAEIKSHYAIIGMAHVIANQPLFYDAINEEGLGMAGLNFVGNACYNEYKEGEKNIATFEFIPYLLAVCKNVNEVKEELSKINLCTTQFSEQLPIALLHWMVSDKEGNNITIEYMKDGLHIHDNKVGVLTNNPPFDYQMFNLNNYFSVSPKDPAIFEEGKLYRYSRGMGGMGLPGDLSSMSRFVKVAFTRNNSKSKSDEISSVSQFFHILSSVEQQKGCCEVKPNEYEYTIYYSCANLDKGIYYYVTYDGHQINAVDMHKVDLDTDTLYTYPMLLEPIINNQN